MLGFLFGFNARLGRLNYFLATIGLAVLMTAICFVIAASVYRSNPGGKLSPADLMGWPTIAAIVLFACASFTLQSMRIRDIGWDPSALFPRGSRFSSSIILSPAKSMRGRSIMIITERSSVHWSTWCCFWR
jgi:uncharacterized membrane protein YhaH (DUF805 family)